MHKETTHKTRVTKGQCASCGQQLYRMKPEEHFAVFGILTGKVTSDVNGRRIRRIPLTIPNLVDKGRCLNCAGSTKVNPDNFAEDQSRDVVKDDPFIAGTEPTPTTDTQRDLPHSLSGNVRYHGSYNSKGEKHGLAKMIWTNGDVYEGYFENNLRNGKGTMVFASRTGEKEKGKYEGYWKNDMMHGKGSRRYPNGDTYDGEFRFGKRHGEGRFSYANGDLFWGSFEDNEMHGSGRYYYASGQRFEGNFFHGERCGRGKLQCKDGRIEIFQYVRNERVGKGVRWSNDKTTAWLILANPNTKTNAGTEEQISTSDAVKLVYEIEHAAEGTNLELSATG